MNQPEASLGESVRGFGQASRTNGRTDELTNAVVALNLDLALLNARGEGTGSSQSEATLRSEVRDLPPKYPALLDREMRNTAMRAAYRSGATVREIASQFGLRKSQTHAIVTSEEHASACPEAEALDGLLREVAAGVTLSQARRAFRALRNASIRRLHEEGRPVPSIAHEVGLSRSRVYEIINAGLASRRTQPDETRTTPSEDTFTLNPRHIGGEDRTSTDDSGSTSWPRPTSEVAGLRYRCEWCQEIYPASKSHEHHVRCKQDRHRRYRVEIAALIDRTLSEAAVELRDRRATSLGWPRW